mgnify:CR=1 FL=1
MYSLFDLYCLQMYIQSCFNECDDNCNPSNKTIENLKQIIPIKEESLEKISTEIVNYNIENIIKKLDIFVSSLQQKIFTENSKFKKNLPLRFQFEKTKCDAIEETNQKSLCIKEFVDGQTNLSLKVVSQKDVGLTKAQLQSLYSIDNKLAAYLLANAKNIVTQSSYSTGKSFFTKLIYGKTIYAEKKGISLDTFYGSAERRFQNLFTADTENFIEQSRIRKNIEKQRYKKNNISSSIKDVIGDIQSLKNLYQALILKFEYVKNFST